MNTVKRAIVGLTTAAAVSGGLGLAEFGSGGYRSGQAHVVSRGSDAGSVAVAGL